MFSQAYDCFKQSTQAFASHFDLQQFQVLCTFTLLKIYYYVEHIKVFPTLLSKVLFDQI